MNSIRGIPSLIQKELAHANKIVTEQNIHAQKFAKRIKKSFVFSLNDKDRYIDQPRSNLKQKRIERLLEFKQRNDPKTAELLKKEALTTLAEKINILSTRGGSLIKTGESLSIKNEEATEEEQVAALQYIFDVCKVALKNSQTVVNNDSIRKDILIKLKKTVWFKKLASNKKLHLQPQMKLFIQEFKAHEIKIREDKQALKVKVRQAKEEKKALKAKMHKDQADLQAYPEKIRTQSSRLSKLQLKIPLPEIDEVNFHGPGALFKNEKSEKKADNIIKEIIHTEKTFIKLIPQLINHFEDLKKSDVLKENEYKELVTSFTMMLNEGRRFIATLEKTSMKDMDDKIMASMTAYSYENMEKYFAGFETFIPNYVFYLNKFENAYKNIQKATILKEKFKEENALDPISVLIGPVQRLPRHKLMMADLINQLNKSGALEELELNLMTISNKLDKVNSNMPK